MPVTPPSDIAWTDPVRQQLFTHWLQAQTPSFQLQPHSLRMASADASFRRYFRIASADAAGSRIIMDAPPDKEDNAAFVRIAALLHEAGLRVPEVLHWEQENGFLLLSDLGAHTMMQSMDPQGTPPLARYQEAVDALIAWQLASRPGVLPAYDEALLRRELQLFPDWYITRHKGQAPTLAQDKVLKAALDAIVAESLAWPSVFVHRNFMPRNRMYTPGEAPGVLDFQDAVYGPITYDIASLMRDAFISWEEDFCLDVTVRYWDQARKAGLPVGDDFGQFYRGVEWMGLQRHLKVAGIFARLTLRDGKPKYLADTPRFIGYIRATCARYVTLRPLLKLVEDLEGITPAINLAPPDLRRRD
jgi:aminoglycoside/choline kinase family phosphotransferase